MVFNGLQKLNGLLILTIAMLTTVGCKDNPYLNIATLPGSAQLNSTVVDSFTVSAKTIKSDSVLSSGLSRFIIGQTQNSTFGKTTASLYASMVLPADQFEALGTVDSAFITLQYSGIFGDTNSVHNVVLYEVDPNGSKPIADNTAYYSNAVFTTLPTVLGSKSNFKFNPKDSIAVDGKKLAPHLRIRITDLAYLTKLQNQTSSGGFANNTALHQVLNGILIKVTSTAGNSMMYVDNSSSGVTGLSIYHHTATKDTATIFHFGSSSVNTYQHDYTGSVVAAHLSNATDTVIYLQGLGGLQSRVFIPYLSNLKNVIINKAELTFQDVNPSATSVYAAPASLYIYRRDSINKNLEDITLGSPFDDVTTGNYFGGSRSTANSYTFNIARYLQKVVDGQTAAFDGFYVNILGNSINPNQIEIGSGTSSGYKIKLKILLTHIK